ncbi:secreted protein [Streptomyces griseoaurantiacus M045]|uniref:Secreted protein n=1 Tax=Streptomyces griseoaurantiacus M045 TaxID=996637 RepID=F3NSH5_9ACTN|nr:hypothetical protein [Streptomyces griseoaurantiacus]EGG43748.1 secreted protein [Streptomyces griseoaurantiacus M045]
MRIRGTTLRLTAVSTLVVLALTGFSSRHGGHGHGHSGGSGGGCSSSSQDHDSSSSSSSSSSGGVSKDDYDSGDDDSYGSGSYGGGSGGYRYRDRYHDDDDDNRGGGKTKSLDDATVELLDCANGSRPYTKVLVTNPNARKATFMVTVVLRADRDRTLDTVRTKVEVPANGAVTAKVRPTDRSLAAEVEECAPEPRAPQAR